MFGNSRSRENILLSIVDYDSTALAQTCRQPKVLCHFNHYFGATSEFVGKSTNGVRKDRAEIVQLALDGIRALPFDMDVRVCGLTDYSLLPVDIDLGASSDPQYIVYASIEHMFDMLDHYDYFLNIEDDILISGDVLTTCMTFNASSQLNEVYLPNRIERRFDGTSYCVDLFAMPGWKPAFHRDFRGTSLGIACNPHSGLSFLSREQMRFAAKRVNLSRRDRILGGLMASAYANLHAPFLLWRAQFDLLAHHVVHLDKWLHSPSEEPSSPRGASLTSIDSKQQTYACPGRPLAYLDAVAIEGAFVKLRGWAINSDGCPAREFQLKFDDYEVAGHDLSWTRIDRPDVVHAYPHAQRDCGFELAFPARSLFVLQSKSAPERLAIGFRAESSADFWLLPSEAIAESVHAIQAAIIALPKIPDVPFMPRPVADRLLELMQKSECYLEYGTGGTTMRAQEIGVPNIVAVESDALWLEAVRYRSGRSATKSQCHFIYVDIGPTGEWSYPVSETHWKNFHHYALRAWELSEERAISPDLVLIDGRFRVACFLASLLFAKPGCRILIDDYSDRSHYASIEQFLEPEQRIDRSAEFIVPTDLPRNDIWRLLLTAVSDPR